MLITIRLSTISFAGIARTEVAVGTSKLASMFVTTRADAPFNFSTTSGVDETGAGVTLAGLGAAGEALAWFTTGAGALAAGWEAAGAGALNRGCNVEFVAAASGEKSLGE